MQARLMCRTGELAGHTHAVTSDLIIGRDNASGVVISSGLISAQHACIRQDAKGFVIEDLGSANGTWVDGERVVRPVRLDHLNVITLAQAYDFIFHADGAPAVSGASLSAEKASGAKAPSVKAPPASAPATAPPPAVRSATPAAPSLAPPLAPPGANETEVLSRGFSAMPPLQQAPPAARPAVGGDTIDLQHALGGSDGHTINMDFGAMGLPKLEPSAPVSFRLDVIIPGAEMQSVELVKHKRYMIGRAMDCDIPVQEKHVSEHHATLYVGDVVMLEDAGSSNGTKVNGHTISTATEIPPDSTFTLGVSVIVRLTRG